MGLVFFEGVQCRARHRAACAEHGYDKCQTDGDFRRSAAHDDAVLTRKMSEVMTPSPISINAESMVVEVIKLVEKRRVDDLVVVNDDNTVAGIIDIQDLPGLKLM